MFFNKLASCPVPKGPFINYVMHLGGEGVCNFVTICDGGGRGGLAALLHNAKVYVRLT